MKLNPGSTIINAKATISGFQQVYDRLQQQVILRGQSHSTFNNYILQLMHLLWCIIRRDVACNVSTTHWHYPSGSFTLRNGFIDKKAYSLTI